MADTIRWFSSGVESLLSDIKYTFRGWVRSPGFAIAVIFIMALGIGANTAIFSLIDGMLLRSLPVKDPSRLVSISNVKRGTEAESFSYPAYRQFQSGSNAFEGMFAFAYPVTMKAVSNGQAKDAQIQFVTPFFFSVLEVRPEVGSLAISQDAESKATDLNAFLSYNYWVREFGGDRSVVGKTLTINDTALTIAGVVPKNFSGVALDYSVDIWVPTGLQPVLQPGDDRLNSDTIYWLKVMGRFKPGVTTSRAAAELNLLYQRYLQSIHLPLAEMQQKVILAAGGLPSFNKRNSVLSPLLILTILVAVVLIIACVNVAGLLLARSASQQNEIAIRMVLGAHRWTLIRRSLTESILLAMAGGALGTVFAYWGSNLLVTFTFPTTVGRGVPALLAFTPNSRLILFTIAVSAFAGILFGLTPALRSSRRYLGLGSKVSSVAATRTTGQKFEKFCVISELGLSLLLLIMTGLLVRSFQNMWKIDLGIQPANLTEVWMTFPRQGTVPERKIAADKILERVKSGTGTDSAALVLPGPFSRLSNSCGGFSVDGVREKQSSAFVVLVGPDYFDTMKIQLLEGRGVQTSDVAGAPGVIVMNQTAARRYFHGSPLGHRITQLCGEPGDFEVVGLARDNKINNPLQDPPPVFYYALAQSQSMAASPVRILEVRGNTSMVDPFKLRQVIESEDRAVIVKYSETMPDLISESLFTAQFITRLSGFFGVLGLVLATAGLYGLISFSVRQRTSEIGVRMALGARRADILWLILRDAMKFVGIGTIVGVILALVITKVMASQLFGVTRFDFIAMAAAVSVLIVVAGAAAQIPAYRASRVDPIVALRYE